MEPKSGWRLRTPHDAISVAELGSTGSVETSAFHGLSSGNTRRVPSAGLAGMSGVEPGGSVSERSADEHAASRSSASGAVNRSAFGIGGYSGGYVRKTARDGLRIPIVTSASATWITAKVRVQIPRLAPLARDDTTDDCRSGRRLCRGAC